MLAVPREGPNTILAHYGHTPSPGGALEIVLAYRMPLGPVSEKGIEHWGVRNRTCDKTLYRCPL